MKHRITLFFAALMAICSCAYAEQEIDNTTCFGCHSNISNKEYTDSVHGKQQCISCHDDIQSIPHASQLKVPNCAKCHPAEAEACQTSHHGKEVTTCVDCHGSPHHVLDSNNPRSPTFRANIPSTCAHCHSDKPSMEKYHLLKTSPIKSYLDTVHGKALQSGELSSAVCTDCHNYHSILPPSDPASLIYRLNVPSTCGKCHERVLNEYMKGIHGQAALSGKWEAPICTDCHGEHTIRSRDDPKSNLQPELISEKICAQCHQAERIITKYRLPRDRVETFFDSYHGLANKYGVGTVANCASCHGAHGILPSSDPNSTVSKANLPKTCGKCHPDVSDHLARGSIHLAPSLSQNTIIYVVEVFYILLIIIVIGFMIVHNILDFSRKCFNGSWRTKHAKGYLRFTRNERIQHGILAITFVLLAYTGFALRYSQAWWTFPFTQIDMGFDWRGTAHKFLAILFCLLIAYHLFALFLSRRGRLQLKELLPRRRDLTDLIDIIRHNIGRPVKKPQFAWYNYIEKLEYWAVIWGSLIMTITGAMMTFESNTMSYFPKLILDVAATIHYYEAILACLAILFWHFYFAIFDPEWYPMNLTMFSGVDVGEKRLPSKLQNPEE